jgi:hypothetical protein
MGIAALARFTGYIILRRKDDFKKNTNKKDATSSPSYMHHVLD